MTKGNDINVDLNQGNLPKAFVMLAIVAETLSKVNNVPVTLEEGYEIAINRLSDVKVEDK